MHLMNSLVYMGVLASIDLISILPFSRSPLFFLLWSGSPAEVPLHPKDFIAADPV